MGRTSIDHLWPEGGESLQNIFSLVAGVLVNMRHGGDDNNKLITIINDSVYSQKPLSHSCHIIAAAAVHQFSTVLCSQN